MIVMTKERKDMTNMSFVGIHHIKDGLIAFADSKATIIYRNGEMHEDVNRQIDKIFFNKKFVCVTHGNNEVFDREAKMTLERYFQENLRGFMSYKEFFEVLFYKMKQIKPSYNDGVYHFIIGSKDEKGYYVRKLTLDVYQNFKQKTPTSIGGR